VSANFRPISSLNNISKILERLFLTRLQPILPAHLVSIIYNQLIANITLLKPLSFTSCYIQYIHELYFSLLYMLVKLSVVCLVTELNLYLLTPWFYLPCSWYLARHSSSLSGPQYCIWHNWPHLSPQSSHFQFRHQGFLSQLAYVLSPQQVFLRHLWLLFLFHITFILWNTPRLCLRSLLFHNLGLTYYLLQLYPFTVSINSNVLTIHSFLFSFPLHSI